MISNRKNDYVNINLSDLTNEKQTEEDKEQDNDNKKGKDKKGKDKKCKDKKGRDKKGKDKENNAQEAHESIRPTNINVEHVEDNETMGKYEKRVYY